MIGHRITYHHQMVVIIIRPSPSTVAASASLGSPFGR
jgi:hypothetical protein